MIQEQNTTTSISIPNHDLEVLKKHFPHCFDKSGNFDFVKFQKNLTDVDVSFSRESYSMDRLGKSYARLLATDPATTLIKEDRDWNNKEENKNSDNVLIKGDNLEVLKHLSHAYHEKVKMIYIDPPYNTGSDGFVYEDDRKFTVEELGELAGVGEEQAKKILSFVNSKSNSHSAWLTFMYPRLYIARQLLKDDGVIFMSIDDNEVSQLRILMDEIFGEENFIAQFVIQTNPRGRSLDKYVAKTFEYIICYSKSLESECISQIPKSDKALKEYNKEDENGCYRLLELRNRNPVFNRNNRPNLFYSFYTNPKTFEVNLEQTDYFSQEVLPQNSKGEDGCWTWGKIKAKSQLSLLVGSLASTGSWRIFRKDYIPQSGATTKEKTLWTDTNLNHENGKEEMGLLFDTSGNKSPFDFPKSVDLIKKCLIIGSKDNDIILDFFAGSGTTGQAVMQINAENRAKGKKGNRKYLLVQLPESIDPKSNKTAYDFVQKELGVIEPTIFEVTKRRLFRASKKIQSEQKSDLFTEENKQDFGFKIFETQPIWDDYEFEAKEFDSQQQLFDESKLSHDDLQTLLRTWATYDNIPLTESLEAIDLDGYNGYYRDGKLYLMDKGFEIKNLKAVLNKTDEDHTFNLVSIIVFGYHFESKVLREIAENVSNYANKKKLDIDFITRY